MTRMRTNKQLAKVEARHSLPRIVRQGEKAVLRLELQRARQNLENHQHDCWRPYWLGVVDGLVLAMSTLNLPTAPNAQVSEPPPKTL